jgi:hypothetical protein
MADLTVTASNVVAQTGATKVTGVALVAVTAGEIVYRDPTTKKFGLVDADHATEANRTVFGLALNDAAANQSLVVQTAGSVSFGAILEVGKVYVASDDPGGIMPVDDVADGDYVTVIGVAETTSILILGFVESGVAADDGV